MERKVFMQRSLLKNVRLVILLGSLFSCFSAYAGGIGLYEFGSPDVGLAAAGYAARAQDASTVFTNPAGMSRLQKSQILGGLQGTYGNLKFSPGANTTTPGNDGGNSIGFMPGGSLFVVQKLNKDLAVGFGALSYFGLASTYDNNWVGRYYTQKGAMLGMTFTPAVSYRVTDWVSFGAGLNMMYGYTESQAAINNMSDSRPDGQIKYSDNKWGFGGNFGILVEPQPQTRLGLTYLTEVKLNFSAVPTFSGLGPGLEYLLRSRGLLDSNLDMGVTVPQMFMFSAYHELTPQWAIMGNVGWQNWSRFGKVDIQIHSSDPRSLTADNSYNDTWHGALGVQYRPGQAWNFSGGLAYDSSAVNNDKRTVTLPMGEAWRFALGAQYAFNPNLSLGAAYELIWMGNMSVNQYRGPLAGVVSGDYNNTNMSVLALNLIWKY
jgi:long-chain fatty acid transport protein